MIKKPLLVSLAAAALLTGNAQAASMYDRMSEMETEMQALKAELEKVKAAKPVVEEEAEEEETAMKDEPEEDEEDEGEEEDEEDETEEALAYFDEAITRLNKNTSGNALKFGVDFRTAVDNLQYKMADGSKEENSALFTNRLWVNMNWAASENMSFTGQLAYNKAFGARSIGQANPQTGNPGAAYEPFDWITSENAFDDSLRVRSAYFFYRNDTFLGTDIPWTFSIGRRPSTNGHLINMRDDDRAASPMGHTINVEFDGLSSKFTLMEDIGMYAKICAGRGMTNAAPRFNAAPYASVDDNPNIDLGGLIFVPYDDGQYSIGMQYYYAAHLIDVDPRLYSAAPETANASGFEDVGNLHSFTANLTVNGIGDEWSDFLDDSTFFVSGAVSVTDPNEDSLQGMFGEFNTDGSFRPQYDKKTGYSVWVGLQYPSLISEDGRWGVEYNHGSKFWRAITYAEDTNIGSKIAARGDAYEAYFTEPLIDDIFSFQLRYTYIDYNFAGSNGFFGTMTGATNKISEFPSPNMVDTAQDIRAYLRYRF
ncbi:DUF3373 family protein [Sulfurimonas sp. HSL3-7]|uniref:DUF3373 family protein n=1 Tax=Sulfonitrofixus jiaomeiensis TaxID=3131938 RepID=UPI0031F8EA09